MPLSQLLLPAANGEESTCFVQLSDVFIYIIFKKTFIYSFMRDTHTQREREREREAETQAEGEAAPRREPNVGLDPRTLGSRPGPKADAQLLSHLGAPVELF